MLTRITGPDLYYWTDMKKFKHIDWRQLFSRHKTFWTVAAHGAGIVLLALLLTRFTIYNISSLSVFAPLDKEVDFKMSDLYNMVADSKAVHQFSPDILIVAIDGCSRRRTLEVINQVAACQPRAIGLDVYFPYPEEDNSYLLHTLSRTPNLVCSEYAVPEPDGIHYYRQQNLSFYDSLMQPAHSGFINLNVRDAQHVVRSFRPVVTSSANDTSFSMACEIARLVAPDKAQALLDRHEKEVTIDFTTYDFLVITADGYHRFQRERAAALAWGLGDGEGFVGPVVTVGSFIGIFEDADVGQCLVDVEQLVVIGARLDGIGCLQEVFLAELIFITRTVEDT